MYLVENYADNIRFNRQYEEIHQFLQNAADTGYNEHFHWGRFEWMMMHPLLDVSHLDSIAIVRNNDKDIVGLITYDTFTDDGAYLIHSSDDFELLDIMIEYVIKNNANPCIKVNDKDVVLSKRLKKYSFIRCEKADNVLEFDLNNNLSYKVLDTVDISRTDFKPDIWKYQMVIHKGFNNEGTPDKWDDEFSKFSPHYNSSLSVFAYTPEEYCALCGIWYKKGQTAYIEPVATIPQFREKGLAKAVVYEAMSRAKRMGALRAVVLSGQEFYYKIGFSHSSEFYSWRKIKEVVNE